MKTLQHWPSLSQLIHMVDEEEKEVMFELRCDKGNMRCDHIGCGIYSFNPIKSVYKEYDGFIHRYLRDEEYWCDSNSRMVNLEIRKIGEVECHQI